MTEPTFLTTAQVVEIHDRLIELYGGSFGLRDAGALESAVATPMATFGGEYLHSTIPAMAAAYLFHITQNHAFLDGNKRCGAKASIVFLRLNGWELTCSEDQLFEATLAVASGVLGKRELTAFFEQHSRLTGPIKQ